MRDGSNPKTKNKTGFHPFPLPTHHLLFGQERFKAALVLVLVLVLDGCSALDDLEFEDEDEDEAKKETLESS